MSTGNNEYLIWIEEQYTASLGDAAPNANQIAGGDAPANANQIADGDAAPNSSQIADYSGGDAAPNADQIGGYSGGGTNDSSIYDGYRNATPATAGSASFQPKVEESTVLSKIKDFAKLVEENKTLSKMVLDGIGGAVAQRNKARSDQQLVQQRADLEAAAVALKRQNNSASVSGLKPIPRAGLIGQPLKRTSGQNVFNPAGGLLGSVA